MQSYEFNGVQIIEYPELGLPIGSDATAQIGDAWGENAQVVVIPAARLHPDFLKLRTGMAGEFMQKFQNYNLRLVILGDIAAAVAASDALRDFVYESNKVGQHLFVPDKAALEAKL